MFPAHAGMNRSRRGDPNEPVFPAHAGMNRRRWHMFSAALIPKMRVFPAHAGMNRPSRLGVGQTM